MGSRVSLQLLLCLTVRITKLKSRVIVSGLDWVVAEVVQNLFTDVVILEANSGFEPKSSKTCFDCLPDESNPTAYSLVVL